VSNRALHTGLALLLACGLLVAIGWLGNTIEGPVHDARFYVDMARNGVVDNPQLAAPFAYRPAIPWAVGAFSRISGVPVVESFQLASRLGALLGLLASFALARAVSGDLRTALLVMSATALSYFHVKFPLFFYPLVDVYAAPLVLLGVWAAITRRFTAALLLGTLGLFVKEFLVVPLVVMIVVLLRDLRTDRSQRDRLAWIAAAIVFGGLCIALPRALLPLRTSMQFIDPLNAPETLPLLWQAPLDPGRLANLVYSVAAYWLPTAMLLTRRRAQRVAEELGEWKAPLAAACATVLLLALYGGTNLNLFVSYTLPVQVIVLASLPRQEVKGIEWAGVLVALFLFNRIAIDIPSPYAGREAFFPYVDFYAGWSSRTATTGWRSLECLGFIAAAWLLRRATQRG
jgi:hypothetical protein